MTPDLTTLTGDELIALWRKATRNEQRNARRHYLSAQPTRRTFDLYLAWGKVAHAVSAERTRRLQAGTCTYRLADIVIPF